MKKSGTVTQSETYKTKRKWCLNLLLIWTSCIIVAAIVAQLSSIQISLVTVA